MAEQTTKKGSGTRVARYRAKTVARGSRRVEVTVPARDAALVRAVAGVLRAGGADAERVRDALMLVTPVRRAQTGVELVAFLRSSPLAGEGLVIERDHATGRVVDVES